MTSGRTGAWGAVHRRIFDEPMEHDMDGDPARDSLPWQSPSIRTERETDHDILIETRWSTTVRASWLMVRVRWLMVRASWLMVRVRWLCL